MFIKKLSAWTSASILLLTTGLFWATPVLAKLSDIENPLKKFSTVGQIFGALLPYLSALAAMIALLFLIWGGIRYMLAQGDPKQIDSARNTITSAVIGLIVVIAIGIIFALIGAIFKIKILGHLATPAYAKTIDIGQYFGPAKSFANLGAFVTGLVYFALVAAAIIFLGILVWGGIRYLNSGGNMENVERARNTLVGAGIGLLIVVLSVVIIEVITKIFGISKSIFSP